MLEDEVEDALSQIAAMDDPEARGHALDALLRTVDEAKRRAVAMRKDLIDALRAQGYSYRQIGAVIGRDWSTVYQIASGKQTGRRRPSQDD